MNCPQCDCNDDIHETLEDHGDSIFADECHHNFNCGKCACTFRIKFAPIGTDVLETGTLLEGEEK